MRNAADAMRELLAGRGWSRDTTGERGDLWSKGRARTVVPAKLDPAGPELSLLLRAVSNADRVDPHLLERQLHSLLDWSRSEGRSAASSSRQGRAELELHLEGASVVEHETSAYDFGRFVMRVANSVKEIVKSERGVRHQARSLVIAGGALEGSVQVVLREPVRAERDVLFDDVLESLEGRALGLLGSVMQAAEESLELRDSSRLRARLSPLALPARQSIARLAEAVRDGHWVLAGVVRLGGEERDIRMGHFGAEALISSARDAVERQTREVIIGTLDGWTWSGSELVALSEDRRRLRIQVPLSLQARVAELNAARDTRVRMTVDVFRRLASDSSDSISTSYALTDVQEVAGPTLHFD